ncbi:hypothetical protein IQ254_04030 [Nodosilinea sp. LEGE 07088]|uniref:hypothetical protein n=1 Tax=Nodosilinea sp. LEGE 07088 TaxID=2777968 RepID=UPI001880800A|nr:hypothetical protein [Nodosilinea sp. LEGE 07088]MBE9136377.1 hypothetical protein [Nodosilinea sp. LEGE 07088]
MIAHFIATGADAADIPARLRSRGWIASALRFTRQRAEISDPKRFRDFLASTRRCIQRIADRLGRLMQRQAQAQLDLIAPQPSLCELLHSPPFSLECTTILTPINLDRYMFSTISPPHTQQRGLRYAYR